MSVDETVDAWELRFQSAMTQWVRLREPGDDVDRWDTAYSEMRAKHRALLEGGKWLSGSEDLVSIIRRRHKELTHSAIIAWLLRPTGRHELGVALLHRLCGDLWPELPLPDATATVRVEVDRRVAGHQARADIVVRGGDTIIVVENKVDAGEGERQAERLHHVFARRASDVRWVFLSPEGRAPQTVGSSGIAESWKPLSYRRLLETIEAVLADAEPSQSLGRLSVEQYVATLRILVRETASRPAPELVTRRYTE